MKWLSEQHKLQMSEESLDAWTKIKFPNYDVENPAKSYAKVFERRHPSPVERQREIEMICAHGEPAYGYATLAQVLSHKEYGRYCNTVLTTNFDDLIADALYLYGERHARPLVVTHEALARYVRTNSPRPTIVKLHGDAHIDPKNLQPETREIDEGLSRQLYPFLQDHALIFVGYGGNDESILKFVQGCPVPALAPPIFWVSKRDVPAPFQEWLRARSALRVDHTDFDQLMHLMRDALNIDLIDRKRWTQIGEAYYEAFQRLKEQISSSAGSSDDAQALRVATSTAEKTLPNDWYYVSQAEELETSNPDEANRIYREGLEHFPESNVLNRSYADFNWKLRNDLKTADIYYRRAIESDPNNGLTLTIYSQFLQDAQGDKDRAEYFYNRAIESNPKYAFALNSYANFLYSDRQNMDGAEAFFKRAIETDPTYVYALVGYARFLYNVRKDAPGAETYFRRAIEVRPNHVVALHSYAKFLETVKADMDGAEAHYKRAIDANPNSVGVLNDYANFLEHVRNDVDFAKVYRARAAQLEQVAH